MIASRETIGKARKMLEGVCENGTGRSLQNEFFKIAGKTGTARVATSGTGYSEGKYLASFTGYFPADNPKYSLIVTFNNPRGAYYGASVSGPVFKEITEKVYATQILNEEIEKDENSPGKVLPVIKHGQSNDIIAIAEELNMNSISKIPESKLVKVEKADTTIKFSENEIAAGKVPDVRGMGASNAVFLMENAGLRVKIKGIGKVKVQSIPPGSNYRIGQTVYLTLS
jgi:cell division protein FtsI (penicillin-binding protein 3)